MNIEVCILMIISFIIACVPVIGNHIAYKDLCRLEKDEKMSIDVKLMRMEIYAWEIQRNFRSRTYLQKYDEVLYELKKKAYINKPMGKFFTIISYGMDNEPTVVYDNATLVMYVVSNEKYNKDSFTMLVNSDGSPRIFDKNCDNKRKEYS